MPPPPPTTSAITCAHSAPRLRPALHQIYAAHKTQTPIVMKLGNVKDGTHKMWQPEEEWGIIDRLLGIVNVKVRRLRQRQPRGVCSASGR